MRLIPAAVLALGLLLAGCGTPHTPGPDPTAKACRLIRAELAKGPDTVDPKALERDAAVTPDSTLRQAVSSFNAGLDLIRGGALTTTGFVFTITASQEIEAICTPAGVPHAGGTWVGDAG